METWIMTAKDFWIIAECFSALGITIDVTLSPIIERALYEENNLRHMPEEKIL